jgi:hypothetical protein
MFLFQKQTLKCSIILDIFLSSSPWASNSEISQIVHVAAVTCQNQNGTKSLFFDSLVLLVDPLNKTKDKKQNSRKKKKEQNAKTS